MEYVEIPALWDEAECRDYCLRTKEAYAPYTKSWSDDYNSEWLTRNYLAVKMIMSATVMLTSFEYCLKRNVRIVQPYLLYYATLSCCRALSFTRPQIKLDSHDFYQMTHSKIINITAGHLTAKFPKPELDYGKFLCELRDAREMFSYKFPAQGTSRGDLAAKFEEVVDLCSLLAENAQLNSECLQASIDRNVSGEFKVNQDVVQKCFMYETDSETFVDRDDYYRTDFMLRQKWLPQNLRLTATEGLVDDYFGSWAPEEDEGDPYDSDENWGLIFPFG